MLLVVCSPRRTVAANDGRDPSPLLPGAQSQLFRSVRMAVSPYGAAGVRWHPAGAAAAASAYGASARRSARARAAWEPRGRPEHRTQPSPPWLTSSRGPQAPSRRTWHTSRTSHSGSRNRRRTSMARGRRIPGRGPCGAARWVRWALRTRRPSSTRGPRACVSSLAPAQGTRPSTGRRARCRRPSERDTPRPCARSGPTVRSACRRAPRGRWRPATPRALYWVSAVGARPRLRGGIAR